MSSHSPLLLRLCSKKNWRGPSASTASSIIRVVFWVIFGSLRFCSVVQCSQAGIYCFVWTEMKNFVVFSIILYMSHQNVHVTAFLHDQNCYNRSKSLVINQLLLEINQSHKWGLWLSIFIDCYQFQSMVVVLKIYVDWHSIFTCLPLHVVLSFNHRLFTMVSLNWCLNNFFCWT